jgi:hypothetical protein
MHFGVKSGKNANFIRGQVCKIELATLGEVAYNKAMVEAIILENQIMATNLKFTNVNKHQKKSWVLQLPKFTRF